MEKKKVLTDAIEKAYVNNHAAFIKNNHHTTMTIEEHVRLLMHELIEELVVDGYLIKADT